MASIILLNSDGTTAKDEICFVNPDTGLPIEGQILPQAGSGATLPASDPTQPYLATVDGPVTINHIAKYKDVNGTLEDGGPLGTAASQSGLSVTIVTASLGTAEGSMTFVDGVLTAQTAAT